ncbi:hypothetical protein BP5796_03994 [Coleophoma crateriformis]|uniref:Pre-rRNA-processing protein TSR2 n=1 Tax=Coleophoma crateriformis TaxID=565419 RepID=A0A3D8SH43_9HELO|nr:hypothetical protein BP5796_03994 [Coleophoma crateriformis]
MASATHISGSAMDVGEGQVAGPLPESAQAQFELGVSLLLNFWPALSLAVSSNWGAGNGATASEKRDWFAGAIVELFDNDPETDSVDVETVLLQVMLDEFEVNVDDDSGYEIAEEILRIRTQCAKGDYKEVQRLRERWVSGKGKAPSGMFKDAGEEDNETDGSEDDESDDDVEMGEAPQLVERAPKVKSVPEVDEDGFTKVTKKR